jgi:hypothetical protein
MSRTPVEKIIELDSDEKRLARYGFDAEKIGGGTSASRQVDR